MFTSTLLFVYEVVDVLTPLLSLGLSVTYGGNEERASQSWLLHLVAFYRIFAFVGVFLRYTPDSTSNNYALGGMILLITVSARKRTRAAVCCCPRSFIDIAARAVDCQVGVGANGVCGAHRQAQRTLK